MNTQVPLTKLPLPQFCQLVKEVLDEIEQHPVLPNKDQNIHLLIEELALDLPKLEHYLHLPRKKPLASDLQAAHERRSRAVQAIFDSIRPYRVSSRPERQTFFRQVNKLFQDYQGMQARPYDRATVLTEHFLDKIQSYPYFDQLRTFHLNQLVEELVLAQAQFVQLFRTSEIRARRPYHLTCGQLRARIEARFYLCYKYLSNILVFDANSPYQAWFQAFHKALFKNPELSVAEDKAKMQ